MTIFEILTLITSGGAFIGSIVAVVIAIRKAPSEIDINKAEAGHKVGDTYVKLVERLEVRISAQELRIAALEAAITAKDAIIERQSERIDDLENEVDELRAIMRAHNIKPPERTRPRKK
jgi:uncharacterized coiled-coil protein SlyX